MAEPLLKKPKIPSSPVVRVIVNSQLLLLASIGAFFVVIMTLVIAFTSPTGIGQGAIVGYAVLVVVTFIGSKFYRKAMNGRRLVALLKQYVDIVFIQGKTKIDDVAAAIGKDPQQVVADIKDLTERYFLAGVTCDIEKGELVLQDRPTKVLDGNKDAREEEKLALNCTSCGVQMMIAPGQVCRCPRCFSAVSVNMKKYEKSKRQTA